MTDAEAQRQLQFIATAYEATRWHGLGVGNEEATPAPTKSHRSEDRGYRRLHHCELAATHGDNPPQAQLQEAPPEIGARENTSRRNLRRQVSKSWAPGCLSRSR